MLENYIKHIIKYQEECRAEIAAAMENGAVVLSPRWLEVCSIHRQLVPVQPFSTAPGPKLFSGMRFSASGLVKNDKIKLAALVTYHGGEYSRALDDKCTHLVTHRAIGPKWEMAKKRLGKVKCVAPGWVLTSAKKRKLIDIADYDPANVIPGSEVIPEIPSTSNTPTGQTVATAVISNKPGNPKSSPKINTTVTMKTVATVQGVTAKPASKSRNRRKKSPTGEKRNRAKGI